MKNITTANVSAELADSSSYDKFESGLSFVGYVCIKDPVRPEVKASIEDCRNAGINVIMITGDAKETAVAVAHELNIVVPGQNIANSCFTGAEFENFSLEKKKNVLKGS